MKKYLIAASLLIVMNTQSEAVTNQLSEKCKEALEPALMTLNMNLDDLKNERNAQLFKQHYQEIETWNEIASSCGPTGLEAFNCAQCTEAEKCADILSKCFWNTSKACDCNLIR